MAIMPTDLAARVAAVGERALTVNGDPLVVDWVFGSDDRVGAELAAVLDEGEALENVAVTLRRIAALGESDDAAAADNLDGAPEELGTQVIQRVKELERGRAYQMEILTGMAGNRRGFVLFVRVVP